MSLQIHDAEEQFLMGVRLFNGEGVEENKEEAVKWLKKAAEQGVSDAQFKLGLDYSQ